MRWGAVPYCRVEFRWSVRSGWWRGGQRAQWWGVDDGDAAAQLQLAVQRDRGRWGIGDWPGPGVEAGRSEDGEAAGTGAGIEAGAVAQPTETCLEQGRGPLLGAAVGGHGRQLVGDPVPGGAANAT